MIVVAGVLAVLALAVLVAVPTSYFTSLFDALFQPRDARALASLVSLALSAKPRAANTRLALGYNANLDAVANATALLNALLTRRRVDVAAIAPRDFARIETDAQLFACFAHFFALGAAAERHVEASLFKAVVDAALEDASTALSPGGNAALMANAAARAGAHSVLLGGPVGARLRPLLHSGIATVVSDVAGAEDQVHLILEYRVGDRFGDAVATRANRFILHSDNVNGRIDGLEAFHAAAESRFTPHVIVAAGLHLLQEQPREFRSARVLAVRQHLDLVPHAVRTHLEFASIGERAFTAEVARSLLASVDSLGFNEQELGDLYAALGGHLWPAERFAKAPVDIVVPALVFLFELSDGLRAEARAEGRTNARRLSRIHFHYLHYHIVAVRESEWDGGREAVAAGSLAVTMAACAFKDFDSFDTTKVLLRDEGDARVESTRTELETGGAVWLHTAPVLVCRQPRHTVGLGDVVSATALTTMQFSA
jgi:ADP-dependent glucokinase